MEDLEIGGAPAPIKPLAHKAKAAPAPSIDGSNALELAPLEGTIEPMELVKLDPATVQTVFTDAAQLDPILAKIAADVRSCVSDVTTAKGRKEIVSRAFRVTKAKTYLDGLGKDLVADMKRQTGLVDASRKRMRDYLDELADETRKPVDDYEAEQARLEQERQEAEAAAALAKEIETAHELALFMNEKEDRDRAEAARAKEQARIDNEARIAREAAEKATREAQERAEAEKETSLRRELHAKLAAEQAVKDKEEAEERARQAEQRATREREDAAARAIDAKRAADAREAQAKKEADEREEQARVEATQAAERRQREADQAIADATAARERDREHRKKFNVAAMEDLMTNAGLTPEQARAVVIAIAQKTIAHIEIKY